MKRFATTAPISLSLDIAAGRIRVIAADRTDTTVEIRPADAARSRDAKAADRTTVEYAAGVLRIAGPVEKNPLVGPSGSVEVTVQVPTGSSVAAKAVAAEFRGVGRLGDVVCEGANGVVRIDEAASVRVTAHTGDVTVGHLTGPARISTGLGRVTIGTRNR
ncbi:hypothetical protein [Cryptosporangium phraense]|uniref:DUF4097 domain-containing protein n=1 Tax=Cryptosporangium phraense TaxID=2593070 RepID=A0A545AJ62_9ACTN|nr:hypothetical protein [Cryptosporangium phraense]TQS41366.1 hypothetical protein FL583_30150 [Cryptosporangium phraense]